MDWLSFQPFSGGYTIAAREVFNCDPSFILSSKEYLIKDNLFLNYINHSIPFFQMEDNEFERNKKFDIIIAMMPCSGLSALSTHIGTEKWGENSESNQSIFDNLDFLLKTYSPEYMFFENSSNLYTSSGLKTRERMNSIILENGYSATYYLTNSLEHGTPIRRERTYIFLRKGKKAFCLPRFKRECLDLVPWLKGKNKGRHSDEPANDINKIWTYHFIKEHCGVNFRDIVQNKTVYKYILHNNLWEDALKFVKNTYSENTSPYKKYTKVYNKVKNTDRGFWDDSLSVFTKKLINITNKRYKTFIHPIHDRIFTIREYLDLMGFPEDYFIFDTKYKRYLTNSVDLNVARDFLTYFYENESCLLEAPTPIYYQNNLTGEGFELFNCQPN